MDLGFIRSLYGTGGTGYASVYLDTSPATTSSPPDVADRWRSARDRLAEAGADEATIAAMQQTVNPRPLGIGCLAFFARGGAVRLTWTLPGAAGCDISEFGPLPRVLPLLRLMTPHAPHVRVGANREGGEVVAVSGLGQTARVEIAGETWPVRKVSAGGWAQARMQRSAEETWEQNAKRTAEAAAGAAGQVRAEFVVVGGDVRERTMVVDLLPKALREAAVLVDREVAPDSAAFAEAAAAESVRRRDAEARARTDEFRARMGGEQERSRRAVEGLDGTLAALRAGLVSDLLLADDPAPDAVAWLGPEPADAAAAEEQLSGQGTTPLGTGRADEALVRAAAGTDASLFFIPQDMSRPRDGVAALLRAPLAAAVFA